MAGVDIQNTGYHPTATGPTDSVSERWRLETGGRITGGAAIADGTVYIGSWDSTFYAIDLLEGEVEWSVDRGASMFPESAAVNGEDIYVVDGTGNLIAWNRQTSERVWDTFSENLAILSSPQVFGGTIFANTDEDRVVTINSESGEILWTYEVEGRGSEVIAVSNDILYAASVPSAVYAIDINTKELVWKTDIDERVMGLSVGENHVYAGIRQSQSVYALDLETGDIEWQCDVSNTVVTPISYHDGFVYVTTRDGVACVDAITGELEWTTQTGGVWGSVSLSNELAYTGSKDGVYAFDRTTGDERWYFETDGEVASEPAFVDGILLVGTREGTIYALE
ncbi:PQQ-binding-like beta-propeller repeat protein [Saliphagus sp. GCM10025334]